MEIAEHLPCNNDLHKYQVGNSYAWHLHNCESIDGKQYDYAGIKPSICMIIPILTNTFSYQCDGLVKPIVFNIYFKA